MDKNLRERLFHAKADLGKVPKDSVNPYFKSKYFDINSLLEHVEPVLQKHGLLVLQPVSGDSVTTIITDVETGSQIASSAPLTTKGDPQKLGSEITYLRRYTLQSLLALQAEDDDANAASGRNAQPVAQKPKGDSNMAHREVVNAIVERTAERQKLVSDYVKALNALPESEQKRYAFNDAWPNDKIKSGIAFLDLQSKLNLQP
jgi:hypothetical protein